jgi:uroporphyrin-3 C-methyltransferase
MPSSPRCAATRGPLRRINAIVNAPAVDAASPPVPPPPAPTPGTPRVSRLPLWLGLVALLLTAMALAIAWDSQRRIKSLERELVQRQDASQRDAAEARALARTAQDLAREASAKSALLEARVSEAAMQRSQVEELLQSVARSRDENVVADVEAAIRVALQQSAITGSADPLIATLRQADERLARYNQPRLERVRRAVQRDLERTRAQGMVDVSTLTARLDEAVRLVDELPLLAEARARPLPAAKAVASAAASAPAGTASAPEGWRARAAAWWQQALTQVGGELRALVRVTRIDQADAVLIAPEQQYFVRENLKLRLLNARLALFARQFEIAQADLRDAQAVLDKYFDRSSKRVLAAADALRQVSQQSRQGALPRPDESLAALAAAAAGR